MLSEIARVSPLKLAFACLAVALGQICTIAVAVAHTEETGQGEAGAARARIERPAIRLDLGHGFINAEPNREPIAEAGERPGIYRAFLVWRQKYAHLAICRMDLCHGSCLAYGDGCLVCAQNPVLPALLSRMSAGGACASGCAPSYTTADYELGSVGGGKGGCH
jgi:hypothetical protein